MVFLRAFIAVLLLVVSTAGAAAVAPSVEDFFRKAEYGGVALSPSGRYLAAIVPVGDQRGVAVLDLQTHGGVRHQSAYGGDVLWVRWQTDERLIFGVGDWQAVPGEVPRDIGIVAMNRDGTDALRIERAFGGPGTAALLRVFEGTNEVLVGAFERTRYSQDVYRYDTVTGNKKLLTFDSPGNVSHWVIDFDGVPRAAVATDVDHDRSAWYVRTTGGGWIKVEEAKLGRLNATPMEFDPSGKLLYVAARRDGADRQAIYEYDIDKGTWKGPIIRHPVRDIGAAEAAFVVNYRERKLLGLRYADDKPAIVWFDQESARIQRSIDAALPGTFNRFQHQGGRWLVASYSDRDPGEVYLLDAASMRLEKLFSFRPWIDPARMASTRWITYPARDGLSIPALLTVPPGAGGKPVPLVVDIHGGPYAPATPWRFDPEVQFFASHGYAVLQPQFRGTLGFGWKLESSGFRKWGAEMQDDLEDGVRFAIAQGIVDPQRVCFYGWSYGGYASMWGAIKNAKLIQCSVALAGVTSIQYIFDNAQTDMSRVADRSTLLAYEIGDPGTDRERFKQVSPLDNADKVGVPILLAYGGFDRRVPLVHGTDFRAALDRYHKPYEWAVYAEEGHGFNKDENRFDLYHRVERFLARYLGAPSHAAAGARAN